MNSAGSLFSWSVSVGTWFATNVRVSIWTPLLAVLLMYRLGPQPGMVAALIVLASLLLHEFAHIFAARATGGYGDEIIISPFGGVALVQTGGSFWSRLIVPGSGPIINLAICVGLVPVLLGQEQAVSQLINPMNYHKDGGIVLSSHMPEMICQLGFVVNWLLVLINLIPVHPLDGGRMLQAVLTEQYGGQASNHIYLRIGTIAGILFVFAGLLLSSAAVVAIGTFVLVMNLEETYRMRTADAYDDSFMGYDFSQGYTSLERDAEDGGSKKAKPGMIASWRQKRREQREEAERIRAEEDAKQVDEILARLNDVGYDALSDAEKRVLKRASNRYKKPTRRNMMTDKLILLAAFCTLFCFAGCAEEPEGEEIPTQTAELGLQSTDMLNAEASSGGLDIPEPSEDDTREFEKLRLTIPASWKEVEMTAMQRSVLMAKYQMEGDVEITVSSASGGIDANFSRWDGQFTNSEKDEDSIDFGSATARLLIRTGRFQSRFRTAGSPELDATRCRLPGRSG